MPLGMDFAADKNLVELARLSRLYAIPDFVKQANLTTTQQLDSLQPTVFADPRTRQFACHNKAATWLSALYFLEKKAEFHHKDQRKIQERLDGFVRYWGLKAAYDEIAVRHAELHKTAESQRPDSDYAYVWTGENGTKERRLPIWTAMQVKDAADWLMKYGERFTFDDRNTMATKILDKAASIGVALGDRINYLEKQAGHGVGNPAEIAQQIERRVYLTRDEQHREMLTKLATTIKAKPRDCLSPSQLIKLARTLDMSDRTMGLAGKYSSELRRPEDVIFAATFTKAAADINSVVATQSGRIYAHESLKRLKLAELREALGDEFVDRVRDGLGVDPEKMASELAALPRPEAAIIEGMLSDKGVQPVTAKAASVRLGFSDGDYETMAVQYAG